MVILRFYFTFCFVLYALIGLMAQGRLEGRVTVGNTPAPYASIESADGFFSTADSLGNYGIDLPSGEHLITFSYLGAKSQSITIEVTAASTLRRDIRLSASDSWLDDIVITGTKTFKRKTNSPVVVQVLSKEVLDGVQACNVSEGLNFQPGLRVETDCQTCNYTQLRINGLAGGYSQILINGRPIFSPLTGLYGLEQLPTNMIDRIEVVRGGGSSLYGSSAIAGTVNILTTIPTDNSFSIGHTQQVVGGRAADSRTTGSWTMVSDNKKSGLSLFGNYRVRDFYDHNQDQYSELPYLRTGSVGTSAFWLPSEQQKLEVSASYINEYRLGGEMRRDLPAWQLGQAEERQHHVYTASLDYQINSSDGKRSLIAYAAAQHTDRDHYTGLLPENATEQADHLANPPVGTSLVTTVNTGLQGNLQLDHKGLGSQVLTVGTEIVLDDVYDHIPAYQFLVDQQTTNIGLFVQSDWQLSEHVSLLSGIRLDHHNLVDDLLLNPRLALLYKPSTATQLRFSYGTGFRAPQAFDSDLHIAFAGGGISRIQLSPDLQPERSRSLSASINHDIIREDYITGFTLEAFRTDLNDAFFLQPIGEDVLGEVFEKQNTEGATVTGLTLEWRANYDRKAQIETGLTWQRSRFDNAVQYIDDLPGFREFVRTPDWYGFTTLSLTPQGPWSGNLSYVYTGSMLVPHFAGAPNQLTDEIEVSEQFHDIHAKVSYEWLLGAGLSANLSLGCRNILNAYQGDFDLGPNRDSNYVYGPASPRTWYLAFVVTR